MFPFQDYWGDTTYTTSFSAMALDQFVNTVKTLSSQGSLTELCDFLSKQVRGVTSLKCY
jgi:hypothetical protein